MNLKREITYLIFEILFCIFFIIFGYYIWSNFDISNLLIAKSYNDKTIIQLDVLDAEEIVLSSDEDKVKPSKLYLHNISKKEGVSKLIIKIDKNNVLFKENTILKINEKYYNLEDLKYETNDEYIYVFLDQYTFDGYETKELEVKLLTKDKIDLNICEYLNYEFISEA